MNEIIKYLTVNILLFFPGVYENYKYPCVLIDISEIQSLKCYVMDQNLMLGANTSLEDCIEIFKEVSKSSEFSYLAEFVKHFELIAHIPVRKVSLFRAWESIKNTNPS